MVEQATEKFPEGVKFDVCDMLELPHLGDFDLVWALNDPINYLVGGRRPRARAFTSLGANLGPEGLLVFDCNTIEGFSASPSARTSRTTAATAGHGAALGGNRRHLRGRDSREREVETNIHRERHWPVDVRPPPRSSPPGLEPLAAIGQRGGTAPASFLLPSPDCDEDRDHKDHPRWQSAARRVAPRGPGPSELASGRERFAANLTGPTSGRGTTGHLSPL